jgi:hypothetical protein
MMSKKLLTVTVAVLSLALSACGMFDGMRGGDGGNTGTSSTAAAECKGAEIEKGFGRQQVLVPSLGIMLIGAIQPQRARWGGAVLYGCAVPFSAS